MDDLIDIARRKERLIARCAAQRENIAVAFRELQKPITIADRALAAARFLLAHPVLVVAIVAAVVGFRRRNLLLVLAARGLAIWRMWRAVAAWAGRMALNFRRRHRLGKS